MGRAEDGPSPAEPNYKWAGRGLPFLEWQQAIEPGRKKWPVQTSRRDATLVSNDSHETCIEGMQPEMRHYSNDLCVEQPIKPYITITSSSSSNSQTMHKYLCFVVLLFLILNFYINAAVSAVPMSMHILSFCNHILDTFKPDTRYWYN